MRVWIVGFGTVGRWVVAALASKRELLAERYGAEPVVVGLANERDGFVYSEAGIDLAAALELVDEGGPLTALPGVEHHATALQGMRATEADVLVEVTGSPSANGGEPGLSHIREALGRGIGVATSNKWPVALHGVELAELARANGTRLRAESTVMSGTPVLAPLTERIPGAEPTEFRGVLNATANYILTLLHTGSEYEDALAQAQAAGLAERDPAADVEGHDTVAKLMVLTALVLHRQLAIEDVERSGISGITREDAEAASRDGSAIKELAMLELGEGGALHARVEPTALALGHPLALVNGTQNMLLCRAEPLGEVAFAGPGAGPELAGQGVLADLVALART